MSLKNNRGFTLVEVLLAIGLVAGLALVISGLTKQTVKSSTKLGFDTDLIQTTNEMNGILSDPVKCLNTFKTTDTPTSINGKFLLGTTYGNSKFTIKSYKLTALSPTDGLLTIIYPNKEILGAADITKTINLFIAGVPGAITLCRALSTSSEIWSHGPVNDIYYSGGNVGIGTSIPTALTALDINGDVNISGKITAQVFSYPSDKRLKKNIETITKPLEKVLALRGVTFDWRSNDKHDVGMIAQEVQKEIPEIVRHGANQEFLSVDYAKVVPFLIEAVKKQQDQIKKLKNEIRILQQ